MLRAPHDAAGALGDCPHCEKEARIPGGDPAPTVDLVGFVPVGERLDHAAVGAALAEAAPPGRKIEVPAEPAVPDIGVPAEPGGVVFESAAEDDDAILLDPADAAEPVAPAGPVVRRSSGRRRKTRGNPFLAGVVLLGILGGVGAAGWVAYDRFLADRAVPLAGAVRPAGSVPPAYFLPPADADPDAVAVVSAGVPMESTLLSVRLSGAAARGGGMTEPPPDLGGLSERKDAAEAPPPPDPPIEKFPEGAIVVRVSPGERAKVVRVDLTGDARAMAWFDARGDLIAAKRLAFTQARDAFFAAVAAGGDVSGFRGPVALNAATEVPGWCVEAVVGGKVIPCCRETGPGVLLFCVPDDATAFTVRGRAAPGGGAVFPYEYAVSVGGG